MYDRPVGTLFHLRSAAVFTARMLWAATIGIVEIKRPGGNRGLSRPIPREQALLSATSRTPPRIVAPRSPARIRTVSGESNQRSRSSIPCYREAHRPSHWHNASLSTGELGLWAADQDGSRNQLLVDCVKGRRVYLLFRTLLIGSRSQSRT